VTVDDNDDGGDDKNKNELIVMNYLQPSLKIHSLALFALGLF
jgi:hypothetical protein